MHGTIEQLFRVEWRPLAELASIADPWRDLAANAIEPNVFYEPAFALAAQPVFGRDVAAGLIWSRTTPARLVGFFPARIDRHRYGVAPPVLVGWTHPFAPLGTPLVDRDAADAVTAAWFDHVAVTPRLPKLMLIPYLPTAGPLARSIDAAIDRRHGRSAFYGRHQRALLAPTERAGYLDQALGSKKRKELRRQRRRLGEGGTVRHVTTSEPQAIAGALDDFLALEASGWKGRAGTAARTHDDIRHFLDTAITALAREGKAQVDRLLVDDRAIAAMVLLRSGMAERSATVWAWKIAYDESFARASPGVQILTDVTQAALDDGSLVQADSCATAGHPMIDHVWRERLSLADRLIAVDAGSTAAFTSARALETLRRGGMTTARAMRDLLRH